MRFTWGPATRASLRLEPKGAVRAPSQAGRRAGPGHAGKGQATHSRPDPARRSGSLAHAGPRAADDDPADHRGHGCERRPHPSRGVWHVPPPACLGVSAQNGLPRARRIRPRRGWRRVLRGARQHDRGVLVPAALLAPPASGHLAGEAAALSRVLPVRAQRTPSRQSPARCARRRLGRMRQTQHPGTQQEPRAFATVAIVLLLVSGFVAFLLLMLPLLAGEMSAFVETFPSYIARIQALVTDANRPWLGKMLGHELPSELSSAQILTTVGGRWLDEVLRWLWSGGEALLSVISLLVVTPIVAIYLTIDWDRMISTIDTWIAPEHRGDIRALGREINDTVAGFVRGQTVICLILA